METTRKRTTGWVVMEALRAYGIDTVFGIPGTHNLEFYRPLGALGIRPVTTRHEQGAGYGADGWSLQTGKPGVVITTSGPGLLNALSAAGTAYCESRPMILLSPGPAIGAEFADIGTLHETKDQLGAASAIVEWGRRVRTAEEAVQAVHDAFELFATTRPRPVYIEVPLDVLEQETELSDSALAPREFAAPAAPDAASVAAAAELLAAAQSPAILAGGGSRAAAVELRALAERLGSPVVTTLNAKGVLDESHPLAAGSNLRLAAGRRVAQDADVLLVVGSKLGEAELWAPKLNARGSVIRIDLLESQIQKNQRTDVGLVGDASAALTALLEALGSGTPRDAAGAEARVAETLAAVRTESAELSAENTALARSIAAALPESAIVATDSSQIAYWGLLNTLRVAEPNSTPYMATYATLGYGLPAALGARIASPQRPSFVVVGDGALMFSMNEFITVVEQGEDVTVIVVDNGGYAEIKQNEVDAGIAPVAVDLVQPDWAAVATAFGGTGRRAATGAELSEAVAAAVAAGGLQLIHIDQAAFAAGQEA
ncbi:acetolactate synthase [Leucobacter sp. OAMLP11]|uniref:thiamine pyrophosphate-binding protein n=2 Tax=Leucobacter TaxID=55968 RepID=UPI000C17D5C2|nr:MULTISPECIES: thiamine pyrophosphate-dependent enzyme [unclassified Leucobacter]PII82791.1 acetolactate synthase [Leucobacter sp. OLCALW19]PII88102.1 acetolactate synthase [Leucobacter sp. OLTLW20]PII91960.1 acetolactate synthase [Leucobacter sp. OLAS13]PIJ00282.1 acetolactate synthase [Leucobacter sp. OLDS2]PIJ53649.1 acetolactate synthase [Leucobacter sp. OAMSW11]